MPEFDDPVIFTAEYYDGRILILLAGEPLFVAEWNAQVGRWFIEGDIDTLAAIFGGDGGGGGTGDVTGPVSSTDGQVAVFDGTSGDLIKGATGTGIAKLVSGVLSVATSGTDYAPATAGTYVLKSDGLGGFEEAVEGVDFAAASHTHTPTEVGLGNVDNVQQLPMSYLDTSVLLGGGSASNSKVPSQLATKTYIDSMFPDDTGFPDAYLKTSGAGLRSWDYPAGGGDVTGPAASVDNEIALFSSTTGKVIKRATQTGIIKAASGVIAVAVAGTDYAAAPAGDYVLKSDGAGGFEEAVAGTDFSGPTVGTAILKGDGAGGFADAVADTDYSAPGHTHVPGDVGLGNVTNVAQLPLSYLDTDVTLAANSDVKVASQKAVKAYIDAVPDGDVVGPSSSVDSELVLFSGTGGKTLKRADQTGVIKVTSGVVSVAVGGTDFAPVTSGVYILKGDGAGGFAEAIANTDYSAPGHTHDDRYYTDAEVDTLLDTKVDDSGDSMTGEYLITNAGTGHALHIDQNGNTSASTSVGGAVLIENTGNTGAGLIIYSNRGSDATGRLLNIRADHAEFPQAALHIDYDGIGNALEVVNNSTDATSQAFNVVSNNPNDSSFTVTGQELAKGTAKIVHVGQADGSDSSASAISIDLQTAGTAAQGVYVDATSGTSGDLLKLRNSSVDVFVVDSSGNIETVGTIDGHYSSTEVDTLLAGYSEVGHSHVATDVTDFEVSMMGHLSDNWNGASGNGVLAFFYDGVTTQDWRVDVSNQNLLDFADLVDPGADRLLFWDDSAGAWTHLTLGTNLTITGTTLDAASGGSHTHTVSDVTDFAEGVLDTMDAAWTPVNTGLDALVDWFYDDGLGTWYIDIVNSNLLDLAALPIASADSIVFYDDSANRFDYLTLEGLAISGTELSIIKNVGYQTPPGPAIVNTTNATTLSSQLCAARYLGMTSFDVTSVVVELRVVQAGSTITWAEAALASAPSPTSGQLTLIEAQGMGAVFNSLGNKTITFTTPIPAGTHVYFLAGSQASTVVQFRGTTGDELSTGVTRTASTTRPSTMANPTAFSTTSSITNALGLWFRWS